MDAYINPYSEQYFAFNIWNIESAKAVIDAAAQVKKNLILQTSTKAFQQIDKEEMRFLVTNYAKSKGIRAYLHLDHCKKISLIKEAVSHGWDSVMIDASEQSILENIKRTNEVCDIVKECGTLVEAEVGQITGVEEEIKAQEAGIARIEDVKQFLEDTEVDMLAVAIGTAHGLYKGTPSLHYDLLGQVAELTDIPLVIHGGTGLGESELRRLLSYENVKKVNISTDVKLAYRQGICESLKNGELELAGFDPLKVTEAIRYSICKMAKEKLMLLCKEKTGRRSDENNFSVEYGDEEYSEHYL